MNKPNFLSAKNDFINRAGQWMLDTWQWMEHRYLFILKNIKLKLIAAIILNSNEYIYFL